MNKLKYLLSAFVLLCFASCKDDPWEDVADGGWNHVNWYCQSCLLGCLDIHLFVRVIITWD